MNRGMINIALQMRGEGHNQVSQTWDLARDFEGSKEGNSGLPVFLLQPLLRRFNEKGVPP